MRSALGRSLGIMFATIPTRDRKVAALQLRALLGKSNPGPIIRAMFGSIGQTLAEAINLRPMINRLDSYVACSNQALIQELLDSKRPVIALSAHTGNWDLLAAYGAERGFKLSTVGRPARSSLLQEFLSDIRAGYGVKSIWRGDQRSSRELLGELAQGHFIAAVIDQDTRVHSTFSSFFGLPARSPARLIELAPKYGAILVSAFIFRTGFNSYEIFVEKLPAGLSAGETLDEYHRRLEALIREHPEQWVWFHKRWRSLPSGERLSSKRYIEYLEQGLKSTGV